MAKFIILSGGIKVGGEVFTEGKEIELSPEEAAKINKKGAFLESSTVHAAKAKAKAKAKADVEAAEKEAAELLEMEQLELEEKRKKEAAEKKKKAEKLEGGAA